MLDTKYVHLAVQDGSVVSVDVDDPTAMLIETWLDAYNKDWNDDLTKQEITDWDLARFVRPECGKKIYDYLKNPHLYDNVMPTPMSQDGIKELRAMNLRPVFVTSSTIEQSGRKYQWLGDYGYIQKLSDYVEMSDKSLIRASVMIDDGFHNITAFNGIGALYNEPWNAKETWDIRVNNWVEFVDLCRTLKG